jgi:hypothetical protein
MPESFADHLDRVELLASEAWSDLPRLSRESVQAVLEDRERILNEVANVLMWLYSFEMSDDDDGGLLRTCRDRLRKLIDGGK